jgi:hypothetical protein
MTDIEIELPGPRDPVEDECVDVPPVADWDHEATDFDEPDGDDLRTDAAIRLFYEG